MFVGVEMRRQQRRRPGFDIAGDARIETALAIIEQHRNRGGIAIGHGDIEIAVGIEIRREYIGDLMSDKDVLTAYIEETHAIVLQNRNRPGDRIANDQVQPVAENRRRRQCHGLVPISIGR